VTDFEKLGAFYLGKRVGTDDGALRHDELVLYDAKDLTTHAFCVGMTGSGKTGLCVSLLEEAAIDGIPAIVIDPKGDLGNLALRFPELRAEDFLPYIDPSEASRKGQTPAEHASTVAAQWRTGLADWGQDGERIRRFRDAPRWCCTRRAARSRGPSPSCGRSPCRPQSCVQTPTPCASACWVRSAASWACSASRPTPCAAASTSSCPTCSPAPGTTAKT
jgi:hypothetical protein